MTNNQKLIRKKCIEANPEIIELKFGCVIKTQKYQWEGTEELVCYDYGTALNEVELAYREKHIKHEDITEIIGRPIHLADVLLAILGCDKDTLADRKLWARGMATDNWNLRKDDLNEQSEETIDFLAELLQ